MIISLITSIDVTSKSIFLLDILFLRTMQKTKSIRQAIAMKCYSVKMDDFNYFD